MLTDRDVSLLKVLFDRGIVRPDVEEALVQTAPPPDGLADFLVERGMVADAGALQRARADVQGARPGDVLARCDLEDQTIVLFLQRGRLVDPQTLENARRFQQELAKRGRIRDLATILVEGGRVPVTVSIELRRRVATYLHRCSACARYYVLQPAATPRRFKCRHCGGEIVVPPAPPVAPPASGLIHPDSSGLITPAQPTPASGRYNVPSRAVPAMSASGGVPHMSPDPNLKTLTRSTGSSARFSFAEALAAELADGTGGEGQAFGNFLIRSELGRGGMGVVYRAVDRRNRREVALKVLSLGLEASPKQVMRFQREAESAAALDHPGLVRVLEAGTVEGYHFLVQEFVDGRGLDQVIKEDKKKDIRWGAAFLADVAEAIDYAHEHNVVHRDLKPANILVENETGKPRVTDFGLAKRLDDEQALTRTGAAVGTPYYMSPEQIQGHRDKIGPGVDIYAMGVILYQLLTGRLPFKAATPVELYQKVAKEDPVPPSELRPTVPKQIEAVCLRCLEKDPARRYPTAGALAKDLRRFGRGETVSARHQGKLVRTLRKRSRAAWTIGGAVLCAVVGAVIAAALSRANREVVANPPVTPPPEDGSLPLRERDELARHAIAAGDESAAGGILGAAEASYGEALGHDPSNPLIVEALVKRARVRITLDDRRGARADLDRAIDLEKESVEALIERGRLRVRTADPGGARGDLERAVALSPGRLDVLCELAVVLVETGNPARAVSLLAPAEADDGHRLLLARARARALSATGQTDEALASLDEALAVGGHAPDEEVLCLVERAALRLDRGADGDGSAALADLEDALVRSREAFARHDRGFSLLARAHLFARDPAAALDAVNQGLDLDPEDVHARRARARIYIMNPAAKVLANQDADWLLKRDEGDPAGLLVKGVSAYYEERLPDAVIQLERVLAKDGDDPLALYHRAAIAAATRDLPTVERCVEKLLAPGSRIAELAAFPNRVAEVYRQRGFARLERGRATEAIAALLESKRRRPDDPEGRRLLAAAYMIQRNFGAAERELLDLRDMTPNDAFVHYTLGHLAVETDRFHSALDHFAAAEKAGGTAADRVQIHFGRGGALVQLGRAAEALPDLEKAVAGAGLRPAQRTLAELWYLAALLAAGDARAEEICQRTVEQPSGGKTLGRVYIAISCVMAKRTEEALGWLDQAASSGLTDVGLLERDARFNPIRANPRFAEIVERVRENARGG